MAPKIPRKIPPEAGYRDALSIQKQTNKNVSQNTRSQNCIWVSTAATMRKLSTPATAMHYWSTHVRRIVQYEWTQLTGCFLGSLGPINTICCSAMSNCRHQMSDRCKLVICCCFLTVLQSLSRPTTSKICYVLHLYSLLTFRGNLKSVYCISRRSSKLEQLLRQTKLLNI